MHLFYLLGLVVVFGCQKSIADIQCPDQQSTCPDRTTCCQLPTKQWGCCPMQSAVCCKDGLHCCPAKTTCNLEQMTCQNQTGSHGGNGRGMNWMETRPAIQAQGLAEPKMKCADGTYCDNGSTCCQMVDGRFGCCPTVGAVCCPDQIHCCGSGYQCNEIIGRCVRPPFGEYPSKARKWMKKYQAIIKSPVICPDQQSQCPENTTCCELESGDYGCCPMPKAVCCEDKIHCCPEATTCDVQHQRCQSQRSASTPWHQKTPSYPVNDISCPDHKSRCPSGATCCPLDDKTYGCCPLPQAVCCEDHLHCCPTGTTCNVEEETCDTSRGTRSPWFLKFKPKQV